MKNQVFTVLFILLSQLSFSQVSGTIKDSLSDKPIEFANIWIKNKALGGTSDVNGKFSIEKAEEGDTLVISYIGFETKELLIKKNPALRYFLKRKCRRTHRGTGHSYEAGP